MKRSCIIALALIAIVAVLVIVKVWINSHPVSNGSISEGNINVSSASVSRRYVHEQRSLTVFLANRTNWVAKELDEASKNAAILSGKIYAYLGYPRLSLPKDGVNVTYWIALKYDKIKLGYVEMNALDLLDAWRNCINYLKSHLREILPNASIQQLKKLGFSLVEAEFDRGKVVNDTLISRPVWVFEVALTWDGYRIASIEGGNLVVEVDALSGNVSIDTIYIVPSYVLPPPSFKAPKVKDLSLAKTRELVIEALRKYLKNDLQAFSVIEKYSNRMTIDLLLAKLGPNGSLSETALGSNVVNPSLEGSWRLYLLAREENIPSPGPPLTRSKALNASCMFLVDLETDRLAAFDCYQLYPPMPWIGIGIDAEIANASRGVAMAWRTIRVGNEVINAAIVMPNAIDLAKTRSIEIIIGWRIYGYISYYNASIDKLVRKLKPEAIINARVIWPPKAEFKIKPAYITLNSTNINSTISIQFSSINTSLLASTWPKAIIVELTIKYPRGSKTVNCIAIPYR